MLEWLSRRDAWALCLMFSTLPLTVLPAYAVQAPTVGVQDAQLLINGKSRELPAWEEQYLIHAVDRLYLNCGRVQTLGAVVIPALGRDQLAIHYEDGTSRIVQALADRPNPFSKLAIYLNRDGEVQRLRECEYAHVLPVAAILESQQWDIPTSERRRVARLTSYEPNKLGWTVDDNDVNQGYLDAVFSVKYPILHDGYYSAESALFNPYLAFSGRFSQYIESRDSSPVIGKRFNPKVFLRHWLGSNNDYLDIGYAHESNGQNISSETAYLRERNDFAAEGQDPDFARDYISRGWDYLSLDWRQSWDKSRIGFSTHVMLKYFLDDGLLQGKPEESNDWEGDGINRRKEYDGVSVLARYRFGTEFCLGSRILASSDEVSSGFCLQKLAWQQTTGYHGLFDNNTSRLELTLGLWDIPVMLWGQTGYNSDLVDYYRKVDSWGVALELQSF